MPLVAAAAIGVGVYAGWDAVTQAYYNNWDWSKIDWNRVSFQGQLGALTTLTLGAGASAVQSALSASAISRAIGASEAITIGEAASVHVLARHFAGGAQTAGKSLFSAGETVSGLVRFAQNITPVLQQGGNFQRIVDAGRTIGIDRATGLPTSTYTVITGASGNLITMFPGVP